MNYEEALALFESARYPDQGKPVAHKTRIHAPDSIGVGMSLALRLHQTDVVTWYDDGSFEIRTRGWDTPTTWRRIYAFAPAQPKIAYRKVVPGSGPEWIAFKRPDPNDPEPDIYPDFVDEPYAASDPGPEPIRVRGPECVAGKTIDGITYFESLWERNRHSYSTPSASWPDTAVCPCCFSHEMQTAYPWRYSKRRWDHYKSNVSKYGSYSAWVRAHENYRKNIRENRRAWYKWVRRNAYTILTELYGGVLFDSDGYILGDEGNRHRIPPLQLSKSETIGEIANALLGGKQFLRTDGNIQVHGNVQVYVIKAETDRGTRCSILAMGGTVVGVKFPRSKIVWMVDLNSIDGDRTFRYPRELVQIKKQIEEHGFRVNTVKSRADLAARTAICGYIRSNPTEFEDFATTNLPRFVQVKAKFNRNSWSKPTWRDMRRANVDGRTILEPVRK